MASPISNIKPLVVDEETRRRQDLDEVEAAVADHKDAVLETITLMGHLHDTGILAISNGVFSQGDEVLRILVQELNNPDNSRVLENGIGLAGLVGSLDIDRLKVLTEKMNQGVKEATDEGAEDGPKSVFQLMKALKDPEISRSVGLLMSLLKGMGKE